MLRRHLACWQGKVTKAKRAHNSWWRRMTKHDGCLRNIYLNLRPHSAPRRVAGVCQKKRQGNKTGFPG